MSDPDTEELAKIIVQLQATKEFAALRERWLNMQPLITDDTYISEDDASDCAHGALRECYQGPSFWG